MEKILVARVRNFSSELLAELILVTPVLRASSGTTYPVWTSTRWQQRLSSPWPLSCRDEENVVRSSPCTTPRQFAALPSRIRTTLVPERCIWAWIPSFKAILDPTFFFIFIYILSFLDQSRQPSPSNYHTPHMYCHSLITHDAFIFYLFGSVIVCYMPRAVDVDVDLYWRLSVDPYFTSSEANITKMYLFCWYCNARALVVRGRCYS